MAIRNRPRIFLAKPLHCRVHVGFREGRWILRKNVFRTLVTAAAVVTMMGVAKPASAEIFGFSCITNNLASDCAILESQVYMEVDAGAIENTVAFLFTNVGPAASSITDVYFNDLMPPLLGSPAYITSSSGVSFSADCSPPNLPGGQDYGFTTSYCADSNTPTQPMGVNPGEWLSIAYTLQGDSTLANVIAALISGTYRVGLRIQGFASGGSESGINGPPRQVTEPSVLALMGIGLLIIGMRLRRSGDPGRSSSKTAVGP
jgi:hypothetical protein